MDVSSFQPSRLIPVTGIKGSLDQERRASSALLAVMRAVPELTYSLLTPCGAPKGTIETFIEPEFKLGKAKIRPDGLIVITRGSKVWRALVEVKTGSNPLELDQLNNYLDICREFKVDALLTISNQVLNASLAHPTDGIDQRRLRSIRLEHLSWLRVITQCIVLSEHVGVEDTERDFILKELIRFLQSPYSGASEFNDMGHAWATVREGVRLGSYRKPDEELLTVVMNFESLMRYAAFTLSARLGVQAKEVSPKSAQADYKKHLQVIAGQLIASKQLKGAIDIPGAAARLEVIADLGAASVHCGFSLSSPDEGRNKSRLNWLIKQIKSPSQGTTISWTYKRARSPEQPVPLTLILDGSAEYELDTSREISTFQVDRVFKMGTKRMAGQGGFITSVVDAIEETYGDLLQGIKPWQRPAPKLSNSITEIIPSDSRPESEI